MKYLLFFGGDRYDCMPGAYSCYGAFDLACEGKASADLLIKDNGRSDAWAHVCSFDGTYLNIVLKYSDGKWIECP